MSRASGFGKPLKGTGSLPAQYDQTFGDTILNVISDGSMDLGNVAISGGTIDGVIIGGTTPGPASFTSITTGNDKGLGYPVCFFGETPGESACWEHQPGIWNVKGDLTVRDNSILGHLLVSVNRISSLTSGENIVISPAGSGILNVIGGITQTTNVLNSNVSFQTSTGSFSATAGKTSQITATGGDIILSTGAGAAVRTIKSITTGTTITVTTTAPHGYSVGNTVVISGTNSVPPLSGFFVVTGISDPTPVEPPNPPIPPSFTVISTVPITTAGTAGSVLQQKDIFLTATNNVNVPLNVGMTFGADSERIIAETAGNVSMYAKNNINLIPGTGGNITIPNNIGITFGSIDRRLFSDGTDVILTIGTGGKMIINGDLTVNGKATYIHSEIVVIDDPIFTLGGAVPVLVDDNKDRGIEYRYNDGTGPKSGFFGWDDSRSAFTFISDATNVNEVISGAPGRVIFGETNVGDLNVAGRISGVNYDLVTEQLTSPGGGVLNPADFVNLTFISVTTAGTVTGTMPPGPSRPGFQKHIVVKALASGAVYTLFFPTGRLLDPGSGTTVAKTLEFATAGQSAMLLWDNIAGMYVIANAGTNIY